MEMRSVTGHLKRDNSRDNFWTKVELVSDKASKRTDVLLCASYEYLSACLKTSKLDEEILNKWVGKEVADIRKKGDEIFAKSRHFEVRAITPEGYENGLSFLKEKFPAHSRQS